MCLVHFKPVMKRALFFFVLISCTISAIGQGNTIYGIWVENSTGLMFLASTDPATGIITPVDTLNGVDAIVFQTGAVSTTSYHFTLRYLQSSGFRLLTVSISTGEVLYDAPSNHNIMGLKYGCNDLLYALWLDNDVYHLVSVDAQTGNQTDLGVIADLSGIYAGTFSFDIDKDWYMVRGIDVNGNNRLYSIDVVTGTVVNSPISNDNVRGNEYDCTTHLTYGLNNNPTNDLETFVSLDPVTGNSTLIDTLWPVAAVFSESYSLNHNTGEYTFAGLMQSQTHLFTVDVSSGVILYNINIGDVITETDQFNCCGKGTEVNEVLNYLIKIHPNPATDFLTVEWSGDSKAVLKISNLQGQIVVIHEIDPGTAEINIQSLKSGIYFVQITDQENRAVYKMIKK